MCSSDLRAHCASSTAPGASARLEKSYEATGASTTVGRARWPASTSARSRGWTSARVRLVRISRIPQLISNPIPPGEIMPSEVEKAATPPAVAKTLQAEFFRPYHMHGSIGPSCGVAEFKDGQMTVEYHSFPLKK